MKEIERTCFNTEVNLSNVGQEVYLIGWVHKKRDLGSLTFIDLRDRSGIIQLVLNNETKKFPVVKNEYLIHIHGVVNKKDIPNPKLLTGNIEIVVDYFLKEPKILLLLLE